ncbi:MAG: glutamate ligase domain-containing protein, partial [Pseudonocardiaceae bacterium]
VRTAPSVLLDAAHNPHGARALAATLREAFTFRRIVVVVAVMRDKDVRGILDELEPVADEVVVTRNSSPRAMDLDEVAAVARQVVGEERLRVEPRLDDAVEAAVAAAEDVDSGSAPLSGGCVVITGSVVTAGEARTLFGREPA